MSSPNRSTLWANLNCGFLGYVIILTGFSLFQIVTQAHATGNLLEVLLLSRTSLVPGEMNPEHTIILVFLLIEVWSFVIIGAHAEGLSKLLLTKNGFFRMLVLSAYPIAICELLFVLFWYGTHGFGLELLGTLLIPLIILPLYQKVVGFGKMELALLGLLLVYYLAWVILNGFQVSESPTGALHLTSIRINSLEVGSWGLSLFAWLAIVTGLKMKRPGPVIRE